MLCKPVARGRTGDVTAPLRRYPGVRVSTELEAPADLVWVATKRSSTLLHVSRGMLGFARVDRLPEKWREGDVVRTRLVFFNILPAWAHELRIARVDERNREIYSNESDALVPVWNHRIRVEEISPSRCRYTDEIEIRAGFLTPVVWLYAHIFYRYRQRRWRRLARSLAYSGPVSAVSDYRSPLASPQRAEEQRRAGAKWLLDGIRRFNKKLLNPSYWPSRVTAVGLTRLSDMWGGAPARATGRPWWQCLSLAASSSLCPTARRPTGCATYRRRASSR